jgi:hypothetical protein
VAKRSARKAAREEVREGAPPTPERHLDRQWGPWRARRCEG